MSCGKTAQERDYITSAGVFMYVIIKLKLLQELHLFARYMFERFSIEGAYREREMSLTSYIQSRKSNASSSRLWSEVGTATEVHNILWKIRNREPLISFKMESGIPKEGGSQGKTVA